MITNIDTTDGIMETENLVTLFHEAERIGSSLMISILCIRDKENSTKQSCPPFCLIWAALCDSPGNEAPSPNNPGQGVPNAVVAKIQIIQVQVFPVTPYLSKS